jgi:23S rRNA pseudouridine1911/1915/1917 synthase
MKDIIIVTPSDRSKRLDIFASEKTGTTRSQIRILFKQGNLMVNSNITSLSYKVQPNDIIEIVHPEPETEILIPEDIPIDILYSDEHLVVVNKQAGIVVYPSAGHRQGTLLNALASRFSKMAGIGGPLRPGVIHRLDKDTSGVMVVALDDQAYYGLAEQFKNRTIQRRYSALIYGNIKENSGEIIMNIGRSASDRKKMSTRTRHGKEAVTQWKTIRRFGVATLIQAKLGTGRTHQIRVHFAAIGHPVLGDLTYGKKTSVEVKHNRVAFPRQMLHAELLGFTHPASGQYIEFSSPFPEDMKKCIEELETITAHI